VFERPEQVIDFLGMMGDAVDNIPGLPGVGEKTAKKLLKEYGSMENLLANTHQLKGKMKENIEANAEKGILSKKLATIITDCNVTFDEHDYELSKPDTEKVEALFQELEFRRMAEQFHKLFSHGEEFDEINTQGYTPTKTITKQDQQFSLFNEGAADEHAQFDPGFYKKLDTYDHNYQVVQGNMGISLLMRDMMQQKSVSFDTETTGICALTAELVGLSFSWEKGKGFYIPVPANRDEAKELLQKLVPFYESEEIEKVGQNLKYDIEVLSNYGITVKGKFFDTMIAHYLINPDMRHGMDILAETYLKYSPMPIEALIGKKGKNQKSMRDVELELIKEYAVEDADITLQLKEVFEPMLEQTLTRKLFDDIEIPLMPVLAAMEHEGISGISISSKSLRVSVCSSMGSNTSLSCRVMSASSTAYSLISSSSTSRMLFWFLPFLPISASIGIGEYFR
jgi:DNA polymerase-1